MLTGENGIIAKAREAKEKTEIAEWEERIDLAIIEAEGEKRNPTLEDVIDKLYDNDIIDDKENDVNRETGAITTNEPEYVIEGELDDYLDNQGEEQPEEPENPPVYKEGDITFSYNPESMTNKEVEVTITKNVEENYTIEYSKYDTNNWEEYVSPVIMEKNGAIYARLKNSSGSSESYATGNVTNIDKLPPNEPSVQIGEVTENSITVTANSTDKTATSEYANSGIQGYQFSKDNGTSWEPSTVQASVSHTFTNLTEDTEYQIKVKAIDNAGNETITANATSQKTESSGISAGDLVNEDKSNLYGSEVKGYECSSSETINKWLILYVDSENIYLIADDYIPYGYNIPIGLLNNRPSNGDYSRSIYFSSNLGGYAGSTNISDEKIKKLNNSYFNIRKFTSNYNNMKATAYLLDTDAWSIYAGEKAEYAIGGPTIELIINSYNEKYGTNYNAAADNKYGYAISENGGLSYELSIRRLLYGAGLPYYVSSLNNATGMWISSPAYEGNGNDLFVMYFDGSIYCGAIDERNYGLRPVVCLKSDVKLEKNSDGSYTIK